MPLEGSKPVKLSLLLGMNVSNSLYSVHLWMLEEGGEGEELSKSYGSEDYRK